MICATRRGVGDRRHKSGRLATSFSLTTRSISRRRTRHNSTTARRRRRRRDEVAPNYRTASRSPTHRTDARRSLDPTQFQHGPRGFLRDSATRGADRHRARGTELREDRIDRCSTTTRPAQRCCFDDRERERESCLERPNEDKGLLRKTSERLTDKQCVKKTV